MDEELNLPAIGQDIDRLSELRDRARQMARSDLAKPVRIVSAAIASEADQIVRGLRRTAKEAGL